MIHPQDAAPLTDEQRGRGDGRGGRADRWRKPKAVANRRPHDTEVGLHSSLRCKKRGSMDDRAPCESDGR